MDTNNVSKQKNKFAILDRDQKASDLQRSMDLEKFLNNAKNQMIQEGLYNAARVITNKMNSSDMEGITKRTRKIYRKEETKAYGILATHMGPNSTFAIEQDERFGKIFKNNRINLALYLQIVEANHTTTGIKNNDMMLANLRSTMQLKNESINSFASRYVHTIALINKSGGISGHDITEEELLTNFIQNMNPETKNNPSGKIFNQIIGKFFDMENKDRRLMGFINYLDESISKRKQISNLTGNSFIKSQIEAPILGNDNNSGATDNTPVSFNTTEDKDGCFVCKELGFTNAAKCHTFNKCRRLSRMIETEKKNNVANPSPFKNKDENKSPFKKKKIEESNDGTVHLTRSINNQFDSDTDDGF